MRGVDGKLGAVFSDGNLSGANGGRIAGPDGMRDGRLSGDCITGPLGSKFGIGGCCGPTLRGD